MQATPRPGPAAGPSTLPRPAARTPTAGSRDRPGTRATGRSPSAARPTAFRGPARAKESRKRAARPAANGQEEMANSKMQLLMLSPDDKFGQSGQRIAGLRRWQYVQLLHGKLAEDDRLLAGVGDGVGSVPIGPQDLPPPRVAGPKLNDQLAAASGESCSKSRITGSVDFCLSRSVPSDLPTLASSPSTSNRSSVTWKETPRFSPN